MPQVGVSEDIKSVRNERRHKARDPQAGRPLQPAKNRTKRQSGQAQKRLSEMQPPRRYVQRLRRRMMIGCQHISAMGNAGKTQRCDQRNRIDPARAENERDINRRKQELE